jgi:hypothetical protein
MSVSGSLLISSNLTVSAAGDPRLDLPREIKIGERPVCAAVSALRESPPEGESMTGIQCSLMFRGRVTICGCAGRSHGDLPHAARFVNPRSGHPTSRFDVGLRLLPGGDRERFRDQPCGRFKCGGRKPSHQTSITNGRFDLCLSVAAFRLRLLSLA